MPAVNNVARGRRRPRRRRHRHPPRRRRRRRRPRRDQAGRRRARLRASRCRATRCASCGRSASGTQVQAAGYAFDVTGFRAPDPDGHASSLEVADAKTGGPDLPAVMGMPRPELARSWSTAPSRSASKVRLGTTFTELTQDDDRRRRHVLRRLHRPLRPRRRRRRRPVVDPPRARASTWRRSRSAWASGAPSGRARRASPAPTCTTAARPTSPATAPPARTRSTPTSSRTPQDRSALTPEEQLATMKQLSQAYHGPWDEIRETLTDPSRVNYTWFETHVLDAPWNRGRVVLIGDAAHTCPPTIAQGGAHGPRGRRRPRRAAHRARRRSTRSCGTPSPPGATSGRRPSSTPPTSSPSGSSTTCRATSRASCARIAMLTSQPA